MPFTQSRDLKKKLLNLFPVKFLKEYFNETGSRDDIIEIVTDRRDDLLLAFINTYHNVTKQNIYLFQLSRNFAQADLAEFPIELAAHYTSGNKHSYLLFPETVYSVYLSGPPDEQELCFLQPIILEIEGTNLIIKCTKLEKNIKTYFDDTRNPKLSKVYNDEEANLSVIKNFFDNTIGIDINDFNQGIKALWELDTVDCHKIRYRDTMSTVLITMDEELTFKEQYPDKYEEMKNAPIGASTWRFLNNDGLINIFTCDPTKGVVNINKFTEDTNQTNHVIAKLLERN